MLNLMLKRLLSGMGAKVVQLGQEKAAPPDVRVRGHLAATHSVKGACKALMYLTTRGQVRPL